MLEKLYGIAVRLAEFDMIAARRRSHLRNPAA
jgi:hypothetical protein